MATGRYEAMWFELSCLIPCAIIVILGLINDSYVAMGSGLIVYLLFQFRTIAYQTKQLPRLQAIFAKLEKDDAEE